LVIAFFCWTLASALPAAAPQPVPVAVTENIIPAEPALVARAAEPVAAPEVVVPDEHDGSEGLERRINPTNQCAIM
ncbi:hypothetical protein GP486_006976, partial [Trichoglossum hirsutum]